MKFILVLAVVLPVVPGLKTVVPTDSKASFITPRILGGNEAPDGSFPYQASVRNLSQLHICAGTILKPTVILTVAHCVVGKSAGDLSVTVGTNLLNRGGTRYSVSSVKIHERFNSLSLKHDLAVLKLPTPMVLTSKISPIDLETNQVGGDVNAIFSGWGSTTVQGPLSNNLNYVVLKTITVAQCRSRHVLSGIDESHVCTFTRNGQGACHGDAGGSLVADGVLLGVMSWGRPCAVGYPDVFVRVSYYAGWINQNSV